MVTVAVYGLNGNLGKDVVEGLLSEPFISKITTPIRLATHSDKRVVESDKVKYYKTQDHSLQEIFEGVDAVINLANPATAPIQEVLEAVIADKVKLYIPSQFGTDLHATEADFPGFLGLKTGHSAAARAAGIKTVDVYTGLFIQNDHNPEPLLQIAGLNKETNEVNIAGDDQTAVNPSFIQDIGKAVAAIVTSDDYSKIPDTVRIYSDKVTIGDLILSYEKKNGIKLTKKYQKVDDFVKEAKEKYKDFSFADFLLYLKAFVAQGEGKGVIFEKENEREIINPGEKLFKWTKFNF